MVMVIAIDAVYYITSIDCFLFTSTVELVISFSFHSIFKGLLTEDMVLYTFMQIHICIDMNI